MHLTQKFKVVAAITTIERPRSAKVNKPYSITKAFKKLRITGFIIFLVLNFDDNEGICVLGPCYSLVFKDNDISEINSQSGRYKLIFRKKTLLRLLSLFGN
jgi:hypothetical protein